MLFSLILLVSCVGSSAHDSAQPDEVIRDVPAPNTGSGSDGRFAKSMLQLRLLSGGVFLAQKLLYLLFGTHAFVAKWNFLLPVIVVV